MRDRSLVRRSTAWRRAGARRCQRFGDFQRPPAEQAAGGAGAVGHDDRGAAVVQHHAQAFGGIRRIERHVRRACLQDADDARDQLERTIEADADWPIGPGAERAQPRRETSRVIDAARDS